MPSAITDSTRAAYLAALDDTDQDAALAVVRGLLAAGADPVDVLVDLVSAAQAIVGVRWQQAVCTVAEEHAATTIGEAAVAAVGATIPEPARPAGRALVACPEREWHALPARIVAESLRYHGWTTLFLGASTPAQHLADYLRRHRITLVALSCSVPVALPAARRIVEAATEARVPVLAGGRAFGSDPARATALGAAAWAASPQALPGVLGTLPPAPDTPPALTHDRRAELAELHLRAPEFAAATARAWDGTLDTRRLEADGTLDSQYLAEHAVHSLTAAILTDDPAMISECRTWLTLLLAAHGQPPGAAGALLEVLRRTVEAHLVIAPRLLEAAADRP
ncbi:cobalamin B12-binding domain-containing protein [Cryptosporangium minutisporangium]|uniref:Cobalamin-dependent protein n=1 Tax=Cryptosporangium minutisporangium TaxID=113569 RepID=A0ABP6SRX2_9ACTN